MTNTGKVIGLIQSLTPKLDPSDIENAVDDWLDDHPEATTTVEDGSISYDKLNSSLKESVDDVADLKSALNTERTGVIIELSQDDLIQGSYNGQGAVVTNANIIRTEGWLAAKSGDIIHFSPGTSHAKQLLYGVFNSNKGYVRDSSWISIETDITVNWDGYIIIVFRRGDDNALAPSQYDATTEIADPKALGNVVKSLSDEVDTIDSLIRINNVQTNIIQGSFTSSGAVSPSTTVIRVKDFIRVHNGDTLSFTPGSTNAKYILYGKFNENKVWQSDSSWFEGETTINFDFNGYIIAVFKRGDGNSLTPEQYDATTTINKLLKYDVLDYEASTDDELNNTYSKKNLIGMDSTMYYPVSIAPGTTLTMSTADGEPLGQNGLNLCFYDSDKNDISSGGWNFNPSYVSRTITWPATIGKTAKFVKWSTNPIKNVQLEMGSVASEYKPYNIDISNTELIRKIYGGVASESQIIDNTFISDYSDKSVSDYADAYNAEVLNSSGNTEQFLFYTDPHLAYQTGNVPGMLPRTKTDINFIEKVYNALPFSFLLCGGDWLGNSDLKSTATEKLAYIDGFMRKKIKNYVPIIGNHDTNYQGYASESSQTMDGRIDDSILKDYWQKFREEQKAYYLYKAPTCHIYVFDTGTENEVVGDYQMEQLKWFANLLNADNSTHIILALHIFYVNTISSGIIQPITTEILKIAQAYNARNSYTFGNDTYDFAQNTGTVSFLIGGHTHRDVTGTLYDIPFVLSMDGTAQGAEEAGYSTERLCTFDMCLADWDTNTLTLKRVGYGTDRTIAIL